MALADGLDEDEQAWLRAVPYLIAENVVKDEEDGWFEDREDGE